MRENRTHGSEGGEAKAFPTPIAVTGSVGFRTATVSSAPAGLIVLKLPGARRRGWPAQGRP